MDVSQPILLTASTPKLEDILSSTVYLHAHCILHDHAVATFLPPLSHGTMLAWWHERLAEVTSTKRHIIVQLMPVRSRNATISGPSFTDILSGTTAPTVSLPGDSGVVDYEVAGLVTLHKPIDQTSLFTGEVGKFFTSPNHRGKGIARSCMRKLEEAARLDGRWNLMLGTTVGLPAESIYPRFGYKLVGVLKNYAYSPKDRSLLDDAWYSKDLRDSELL